MPAFYAETLISDKVYYVKFGIVSLLGLITESHYPATHLLEVPAGIFALFSSGELTVSLICTNCAIALMVIFF
jgi:hypothetical protein